MRILFLSLEFSAGTFSGNGVLAMSQVRALSQEGHKVFVVSAKPSSWGTPPNLQGAAHLHEVPTSKWGHLDAAAPWEEFAEGCLSARLIQAISDFSPEVALGVDWTSLRPYQHISDSITHMWFPYVYLNYRVFARTAGPNDQPLISSMETSAMDEAVDTVVLGRCDSEYVRHHLLPANKQWLIPKVLLPPLRAEMLAINGATAAHDACTPNPAGACADGDTACANGNTACASGNTACAHGNAACANGNAACADGNTACADGNAACADGGCVALANGVCTDGEFSCSMDGDADTDKQPCCSGDSLHHSHALNGRTAASGTETANGSLAHNGNLALNGSMDLNGNALIGSAAPHGSIAAQHGSIAAQHGSIAAQHGSIAAQHGSRAAQHGSIAAQHGSRAAQHGSRAANGSKAAICEWPLGADDSSFSEEAFLQRRRFITCCVRLSEEKEPHRFVDLVIALHKRGSLARFGITPLLIGSAKDAYAQELKQRLQQQVPAAVLEESFLGPSQLARLYQQTRLNVHPCSYDAYGMTVVEAASQGAPSLVNTGGSVGATDLLSSDAGEVLLADVTAEPEALAAVVEQLLSKPARLMQVASRARSKARSWSEQANARQLIQLVQAALDGPLGPDTPDALP